MEGNDLGTWASHRSIVVLEGVLATPTYGEVKSMFGLRSHQELLPSSQWVWSTPGVQSVQDRIWRYSQLFDVVTFMGEDVAEGAADHFMRYDIGVVSTEAVDFEKFCQSLRWAHNVDFVYDSSPERARWYGQRGFVVSPHGGF